MASKKGTPTKNGYTPKKGIATPKREYKSYSEKMNLSDEQKANIENYKNAVVPTIRNAHQERLWYVLNKKRSNRNRADNRFLFKPTLQQAKRHSLKVMNKFYNVFPEATQEQVVNAYETAFSRFALKINKQLKATEQKYAVERNLNKVGA